MPSALEDFMRGGLYRYGTRMGAQPGARTWDVGTAQAENQIDTQFIPRLQAQANIGRNALFGGLPGSTYGALGLTPASAAPKPGENAFGQSLARLSKNPRFDDLTNRFIDELEAYKPNRALVRGAAQDQLGRAAELGARTSAVTDRALDTLENDRSVNRNILDDFVSRFGAAVPELDAQTKAQTQQLNKIFLDQSDPNSLAAQQASIRSRARAAEVDAVLPQIERAVLASNVRSGLTGVNSVNNLNLRNTALALARDNAVRNAQREAADLANLTNLQRSTAGLPQEVATTNLLRSKIPLDTRLELAAKELGLSGQALQQALSANAQTTSNLGSGFALDQASDPIADLARRQAVADNAQRSFLNNNFLEVAQRGQVPNYQVPSYYPTPPYYPPPPPPYYPPDYSPDDYRPEDLNDLYNDDEPDFSGPVDNFVPPLLARPLDNPNPYYGPGGYGGYGALRPNQGALPDDPYYGGPMDDPFLDDYYGPGGGPQWPGSRIL